MDTSHFLHTGEKNRAGASYHRLVQPWLWWMSVCIGVNKLRGLGHGLPGKLGTMRSLLNQNATRTSTLVASAASEAIWSDWTELPEITVSHKHVGPSPIYALALHSYIAIENSESPNHLIATLDCWRLKIVWRRPHHNLDIPGYDELLGEAIPSKQRHFFSLINHRPYHCPPSLKKDIILAIFLWA